MLAVGTAVVVANTGEPAADANGAGVPVQTTSSSAGSPSGGSGASQPLACDPPPVNDIAVDGELPVWVQRLQENPITPGVGLAGVRLGDADGDVRNLLGDPTEEFPVTSESGEVLDYALTYRHQGIFLGLYLTPDARQVKSIRLSDDDFNQSGLIPQVCSGAGIGSFSAELQNALGPPASTMTHVTCPESLGDRTATTFSYPGIDFWVCANDRVNLVDL